MSSLTNTETLRLRAQLASGQAAPVQEINLHLQLLKLYQLHGDKVPAYQALKEPGRDEKAKDE